MVVCIFVESQFISMRIDSILLVLLLLTISLVLWAQNSADAIIGPWLTVDKTGEISDEVNTGQD